MKRFTVKRQLQKQITRTDGHARRETLPGGGDSGGKDVSADHSARIVDLMRENPKISVSAIVSAIGGGKRSIEREIAALKASGRIARKWIYAGEWRVLDLT